MLSLLDIQNLPDPFLTEFIITLKMSSFFYYYYNQSYVASVWRKLSDSREFSGKSISLIDAYMALRSILTNC